MANFDPGASARWSSPRTGRWRIGRWSSPTRTTSRRASAPIYTLNSRTLVRAGFGIFYNQFDRIGSEDQLALNPPGLANIDVQSAGAATVPDPASAGRLPGQLPRPGEHQLHAHHGPRARDREYARTMVQQFGAGIERQFGESFVASADFVGSSTDHLAVLRNFNQPTRGTLDANGPVPFPAFGNIQWREMTGTPATRGWTCRSRSVSSDGYSYRVSYTVGEARDSAPEHLNASSGRPQNGRDLASWEAAERLRHSPPRRRRTSSPNCRSGRASRCCRTASAATCWAAGW